ncbi:glycosyltransferase [Arsenicicoccus sp. oral taxon 190]|uniref:glycosyltransferase n=1 Tax=Arsenicicoccus sp. oral taxon 190 TaxID=1658671 RepID=UPI00067A156C|nr:glycosyltransferase [Arsenicicoccus sp. oral taxon 190]AKT52390.1 glycosyl transferase [Arsenicicoccus sp. oral taxon 190]
MSTQTAEQTTGTPTASDTNPADGYRIAQRVVFPQDGDLDVLPLYVDREDADHRVELHPEDVQGRTSFLVRAGQRASFGSYFNAFPASYWRRWTVVTSVRLTVRTTGPASIIIYRSNARGNQQRVDSVRVSGDSTLVRDLPLATFGDGGWYWFEVVAGGDSVVLDEAHWSIDPQGRPVGTASLAVTTFNRPDYCVRNIAVVAEDERLRSVLDEMIIVDQGTEKVAAEDGFEEASAALGDQLRIVDQANLGGSGGFSRGMYEATTAGRSDYVILLDDDILMEPESITRLTTFADMARKPVLVGGHMFDLHHRSVLHTFGEIVEPWLWGPKDAGIGTRQRYDFAKEGLRENTVLHQRVDVDYNGWWMTLIPTSVVRELGLSLPVFIKWDDAEYGLRAKAAGYHTVSLPGAAVWHVAWIDKDDMVGWQAYFHERNRMISALIHSPVQRGGDLLTNSTMLDLRHMVSMQYYTVKGRLQAQRDVLDGPDRLHEILPTRLGEIRKEAADFTDARVAKDVDAFPDVRLRKPRRPSRANAQPTRRTVWPMAVKAVLRQFTPVDEMAREAPQARIAHKDNKWWRVAQYDSAVVSTADGVGQSMYVRDNAAARSAVAQIAANHAELVRRWPELVKSYREALPRITSFEAWEKTFGITRDQHPEQ